MSIQSIKTNLEKLGLSNNDAKVYLELIKLGTSLVGPLITKTQLHRNIVYTSLEHLVAEKLVAENIIRGKKNYTTTSPNILTEQFEEKYKLAAQTSEELNLLAKKSEQEITIHQGNEEYLSLLTSCIRQQPKGSTIYIIGTGGQEFMSETMRPIWKKYHKVAHEQGIKIKMIGYESQRESFLQEVNIEKIYNVRFIPKLVENPSGIQVFPEAGITLNVIYSDRLNPTTAIKIKDEKLTQGYLNFFDNLWDSGQK